MSLWDLPTDTGGLPSVSGDDRTIPSQHPALGTTSITPVQENDLTSTTARVEVKDAKIVVHDGSNTRIIIGLQPDGTYGMTISKSGTDVEDAF